MLVGVTTRFNNRRLFLSGRLVSSLALIARPQTYCKVQNTHSTCRAFHCPLFTRKSYHTSEVLSHNSYQTHPGLQSKCLQHWFKNWHELRRNKLTASTFGMAIGFWPRRRVQLWLEKVGAIEPFSGDLATFWSNIKEEEALEQYKLQTGNPISFPKFQVYGKENPQDDWLAGSPDGMIEVDVYGCCRSSGVLEIKCPYFDGDNQKAYPWSRIPLYCMPQAQGLMEIMDKDWMDLYVWTLNGSSLFRIPRDREYWELVKMALSDFWWEHVEPAKEMYSISNVTNPLIQLRSLKPAPRHELCGAIVHWSKCLVDDSVLLMREMKTEPRFEKFNSNSWKKKNLRWKKPIEGWVKLNFDGTWNPVTRVGAAGWVLRDHNGVFISAGAQRRIFDSAQEVEAWALKLGTEFLKVEGMDKVQIEGVAKLVIDKIKREDMTGSMNEVTSILDILDNLRLVSNYKLYFVARVQNDVAHGIAKWVHLNCDGCLWNTAPDWLIKLICKDIY